MNLSLISAILPLSGLILSAAADPKGMALVPKGAFTLPFRNDTAEVRMRVDAFYLDEYPVTQSGFLVFLKANPGLARSRVQRMFADPAYLSDWRGDASPGAALGNSPVTRVSWHAAKAYCACQGKRLPTTAEWEWAAKAMPRGTDSAGLDKSILAWYAKPANDGPHAVGSGSVSGNGIRDLFGLVWEWTSDFDAFGFAGLNQRGIGDSGAFCGAGSARAVKDAGYATYMRWAFRQSLQADYSLGSLGFRCARDWERKPGAGGRVPGAKQGYGPGSRPGGAGIAIPIVAPKSSPVPDGSPLPEGSLYQVGSRWMREDGSTLHLADLRGQVKVMSMFFTGCANLCPMLLGQLQSLEQAMPNALKTEVGFVLVTLDAKEDTAGTLKAYRGKSHLASGHWTLLRGSADDTRELAALLGVRYTPKQDDGQMGHTGLIAILDRDGRMVFHVPGITDQKAFLAELDRQVFLDGTKRMSGR